MATPTVEQAQNALRAFVRTITDELASITGSRDLTPEAKARHGRERIEVWQQQLNALRAQEAEAIRAARSGLREQAYSRESAFVGPAEHRTADAIEKLSAYTRLRDLPPAALVAVLGRAIARRDRVIEQAVREIALGQVAARGTPLPLDDAGEVTVQGPLTPPLVEVQQRFWGAGLAWGLGDGTADWWPVLQRLADEDERRFEESESGRARLAATHALRSRPPSPVNLETWIGASEDPHWRDRAAPLLDRGHGLKGLARPQTADELVGTRPA